MASLDTWRFLRAAVRDPVSMGAIAPSSLALGRRMMQGIELEAGDAVVELGPGTGSLTRVVRGAIPQPSAYLGIERDEAFVSLLNERYPELRFVHGLAQEAERHVAHAGIERVKLILSSIPFAGLPSDVQDAVMASVESLMQPGTYFRTYQYTHAWWMPAAVRFRRSMRQRFGPCQRSGPVVWNLPPAFVLTWSA